MSDGSRPLVIAHAPSHRGAKGTKHVLAAATALKDEGLVFELRLIEDLSRDKAIKSYCECDVVIDQLLAGWYGGLGVEAMALGKPVVACLRASDLASLDPAMRAELPVVDAAPESIADVMRRIIAMPRGELAALGRASRDFALRWHSPLAVAERTLGDYQRGAAQKLG